MQMKLRTAVVCLALVSVLAGAAGAVCGGDCNDDNKVAINELIIGVNISFDPEKLDSCPSFDTNNNLKVEINELIGGVNNSLDGCPTPGPSATPTETPTITVTPSVTPTTEPGVCVFDSVSPGSNNQSSLELCAETFGGCGAVKLPIQGSFRLTCDQGAGTDGIRDCTCELIRFDPVNIVGIGFVCVDKPDETCPARPADCDGGSNLGVDLDATAQIGACENPQECDTLCDAHCASLNKVRFAPVSGCESFCKGGDRAGLECECDILGGTACPRDATLDCPGGSCVGKDGEFDRDCQCQCLDEAVGPAAPAGALSCSLGVGIRVEPALPCNRDVVLVNLPPLCAPFTSANAVGVVNEANEGIGAGVIGPKELSGQTIECADVDASNLGGLTLVTNLAFFDSTIGDLLTPLKLDCN